MTLHFREPEPGIAEEIDGLADVADYQFQFNERLIKAMQSLTTAVDGVSSNSMANYYELDRNIRGVAAVAAVSTGANLFVFFAWGMRWIG